MHTITIGIVDDHTLFRQSLVPVINSFEGCQVVLEASQGIELSEKLSRITPPEIVLLDLHMPIMDGYATSAWLQLQHPAIKIIMISMFDSDLAFIRLLKNGVCSFLKKDIELAELRKALLHVHYHGHYFSSLHAVKLVAIFQKRAHEHQKLAPLFFESTEEEFLRLSCTDKTYKEIASIMHVSLRQVDVIRDRMFTRLDVRSRVALSVLALRSGLVLP